MRKWNLIYKGFVPQQEGLREALCTLGNGYFATRGAAEESKADRIHYPGTYIGGGYNRLTSTIHGRKIENEDLVNWPNWLPLTFRVEKDPWFGRKQVRYLEYHQDLDLQKGLLVRKLRFQDKKGRITRLICRRFVHMGKAHFAGIEWTLTPENWSGEITVKSGLDGNVQNTGVKRYRQLKSKHLDILSLGVVDDQSVEILVRTNQSHLLMAQACRTQLFAGAKKISSTNRTLRTKHFIGKTFCFPVKQGNSYRVEKIVTLFTSRDRGISEPSLNARLALKGCERYRELLKSHIREWEYLWDKFDISFNGHAQQELSLRVHVFHLLETLSRNTIGFDVGVPARGLHGEAYRGHIFWDEIFVFPIYNFRIPEVTRSLLVYRYQRLDMARALAKANGFAGAMYPWQSGSDGREETQVVHLNPKSGHWIDDHSQLQRHVNIAIAYNIWQYYSISGDITFLEQYGAEMFLEIAKFFASLSTFNKKKERYEILGVMGPDEYHEAYPKAKKPGINNNAYTNVMVVWILRRAFGILWDLPMARRRKLMADINLGKKDLDRWKDIAHKMFVPFHKGNIISQFEGYEKLKEFNWEAYRKKYGNIERLDRILEAEGDSPNNYQLSKQADVTMLFYLLPYHVLKEIFDILGYPLEEAMVRENISYYLSRTSHGSTLSKVVHGSVLNRIDRRQGWHFFNMGLKSDLEDVQGGTTPEGIHLGAMAGTVDIAIRDFAGVETKDDFISFDPLLPDPLKKLRFKVKFRKNWLRLEMTQKCFDITVEKNGRVPVKIEVRGEKHSIASGSSKRFSL